MKYNVITPAINQLREFNKIGIGNGIRSYKIRGFRKYIYELWRTTVLIILTGLVLVFIYKLVFNG